MDILITISDLRSGATHPVVLSASAEARFGDVEPLLTQFIDRQSVWEAKGRQLRPDDLLMEAGVCDGAVLQAGEPAAGGAGLSVTDDEAPADDVVGHLRVVSGPDAGITWTLRPGVYVIGRSRSSDLALPSDDQVSRQHARLQITTDGVLIEDLVSSNGTLVAGVNVAVPTRLAPGDIVELGDSLLSLSVISGPGATVAAGRDGSRVFNRPPRILTHPELVRLSVPVPPGERQHAALSIAGIVLPLLIGGVMALLVKPIFILFALLSPVMAMNTYMSDRRKGARSHRKATAQYQERKAHYSVELKAALERETAALRTAAPDPAEIAAIAGAPLTRLWERRRKDPDFLMLRIGLADRTSTIELVGGSRPDNPDSLPEEQPVLKSIPATVDLETVGVLGVAGGATEVQGLARWLAIQLATLHAPDDVQLVILGSGDSSESWDWSMWLPHLRLNRGVSTATVGFGDEAVNHLATQVAATIDTRIQTREAIRVGDPARSDPAIVVVLGASRRMRANPAVAKILRLGPTVGVSCICLADAAPQLPEECRAVAVFPVGEHNRLDLRLPDGSVVADVTADKVSAGWAEQVARALAPLRIDRQQESAAGLPDSLVLLDLLGMEPPTAEAIVAGWAADGRTTAALIGVTAAGPLVVDLHQDGPHGLVAGTTGSGKSELLQTLIASLAVANRPDALNFVLVDYKGGSAFRACALLPHTVGMVTDLDGHLTERALTSLAAEVRHRERLFRDANAKDIDDYWRFLDRAANAAAPTLARILIVIDEFASLVEEIPEFVDGLVDLARRGRSFGIHLILATQRPAGVVSPAIKTNTNLRIAMRVTDAMDSTDVIDSQLAARIAKSAPGRGYVRVGHEQLVEFQAARVGGRRRDLSAAQIRPSLRVLTPEMLFLPPPRAKEAASDDDVTDLDVLVDAVVAASDSLGVAPPGSPWLSPLPELLLLTDVVDELERAPAHGQVPFGLEDMPSERDRAVVSLDLADGSHLMVAGDPGSGRSTVLRTIAASAASRLHPGDLHMYAIDCGNGALLPLAELPQCGAVVSRSEVERTDRLLSKLLADVEHRQRVLAAGGFSSLGDQRASAPPDQRLPYLLLLLDRWEGFTAAFEGVDGGRLVASLQNLLREGPGAGLRVALTGDRSLLVGRMATTTEFRLVLRLNDRSGYSLAGLNPRHVPDEIPAGRAFRADSGREVQIALLAAEATGPAQVAAFRQIAERCRSKSSLVPSEALPEPVAVLPTHLALASVPLASGSTGPRPLAATIGVGGNQLEAVVVDLQADGPGFVVTGPRKSGRSNALVAMARSLAAGGTEVIGIVTLPSPLGEVAGLAGVVAMLNGRTATPDELSAAVARTTRPLAVLVDDVEQLLDTPLATALEGLLRGAREHHRAIVIAGGTAELNATSFRGLVAEARKSRAGLLLSPNTPADAELFGVRLPKTVVFSGPAGRAVQIANGNHRLVQIADALNDAEASSP